MVGKGEAVFSPVKGCIRCDSSSLVRFFINYASGNHNLMEVEHNDTNLLEKKVILSFLPRIMWIFSVADKAYFSMKSKFPPSDIRIFA